MHPQIITNPPPCFMVWWTCWGPMWHSSPIQHHELSSRLNLIIFVSSLKFTCFQLSMVQISYLWASLKHARTCLWLRIGFFCYNCAPNPTSLKARLIVMSDNNLHVPDRSCFVVADAIPSRPPVIRVTQHLSSHSTRRFGCPPLYHSI